MSLFKIRTFWSTHCEDDESFDQNSLLVTKLNSDSDVIVTGSHSGILRIFKPLCETNDSSNLTDYKVTDLLIETIIKDPILQISCGRLVSGSPKKQLAILQPRLVGVYALVTKEGATDHGVQHILQLLYEHKLRRSAYNFFVGPFGGSQSRDFICVQSLDGLFTFFEQESFAFCCFLPDFLLPGPLVFVRKSDSFVTVNSAWQIMSFKYKILSEAGQNSLEEDDVGKKVTADWKFNLGEAVTDLDVVEDPSSRESFIMVLGERNMFCLSDIGKLKYMKRLDFSPTCFINFSLNDRIMSLVVSETNNLLIYQNTSLKWCAQLQTSPISVKRAFMHNISGALVFLSQEGILECSYLGTEPSLFVAPPLAMQELDFEKAGVELATLYKTIKNSYSNDIKVTNASAERELTLNVSVSPHLEPCTFDTNIKTAINNQMCSISIEISPQALFEEVQITLLAQYPLRVEPQIEFFNNLSEKTSMNCYAFMEGVGEVVSLNVEVVASFISSLGVPRSVTRSAMLPLNLVLETCPPLKDSDCKVTLNINQSPVGLSVLFPEYTFSTTGSAIGFRKLTAGEVVTILLAKSSERYRLQSNSFASLSLLVEQMVDRLKKHYSNKSDFAITFNPPLPINEPLQYIGRHFEARQKFSSLQEQLTQLSSQFRLIQKRLIAKFKVKNPTPLSNLELLLEDTFNEIIKLTTTLEDEKQQLLKTQTELSCALHVLANLIKLMDCNNNVAGLIQSAFNPCVYDMDGQNWEDVHDASLCYLLRTVLAKSEKDKLRAAHTSFEEVKDITKIEKRLSQVLERIPKGALLETHFPLDEDKQEGEDDGDNRESVDAAMPIGSKIGESSSRLLSARKGLLRRRHKVDD
ncbi:protein PTHB1 [Zophobas morio]|uniref:protein PTHB1 n=1 Tax=Zophobas morio TaxID=2755281 RepID=UPI003083CB2B